MTEYAGKPTGVSFVSWPGGVGAPTTIPTGGKRKTRKSRKTRKGRKGNRKGRTVHRRRSH